MTKQKTQGNVVGVITMIFLFGMIAFVTNLAAPIGVIWKSNPVFSNLGMLGNMMNFLAYLVMGIPAGRLLNRIGYKKTALVAIGVGFFGILIQLLSGFATGYTGFGVYLAGAFVAGICVCLLNTTVNPMLNILGGGGNKGNQLIQAGGTFNSLMATITPMVVGSMIGEVTKDTAIADVNPLLYIAMGVFLVSFVALLFIPITEPERAAGVKFERSPWAFRHFVLGAVAIFVYVGVEVGIPYILMFFLADGTAAGAGLPVATAAATAGFVAGTYWFLMLIGRFVAGAIGGKVSSRAMMVTATAVATVLVVAAIFSSSIQTTMPVFTGRSFEMAEVPLSALLLVLCGLCTSVLWGVIFNLATEGLGKYVPLASGIFMMMVVGGGILPLIQEQIAIAAGYMTSYWLVVAGILYMFLYALIWSKNVNKDIKVN
jgi:FHS family L-fucose permease-like MFS transporter